MILTKIAVSTDSVAKKPSEIEKKFYLEIYSGHLATAVQLDLVPFLVERIVIHRCVLGRIPVEHELPVIQTTNATLLFDDAEISLLEL